VVKGNAAKRRGIPERLVRDKDFHRSLIEKYGGAMSEVREVTVTIKPRKGTYPGQVTYGWYTLQDGVVTLTDREGNPAGEETGRKFTHKLSARRTCPRRCL
jgi:hypothetical protein